MIPESHLGAVCYIDLLGFSYLTELLENKKENANDSYETFDKDQEKTISTDQAYEIVNDNLRNFHNAIKDLTRKYSSSNYSIISDSLFITSESCDDILYLVANLFRECLKKGVLLRAGLAYGRYYTVETPIEELNFFGPAVTRAVHYEGKGKGCRIFTDSDFSNHCNLIVTKNLKLFFSYKNLLDYSTIDCFEWPLIKDNYILDSVDKKKMNDLLNDNHEIICKLLYSPNFDWNLDNNKGIEQIRASTEYLANICNRIYRILLPEKKKKAYKNFDWKKMKNRKRNNETLNKMISLKKEGVQKLMDINR